MADEPTLSPEISLNIKGPSELKLTISISLDKTVSDLKAAIASQTDVEQERQRLIYSGKVLKDEEPLSTYRLLAGHTIHMVKGAPKIAAPAASSSSASAAFGAPSAAARLPTMAAGQGTGMMAALEGVQGHGMGGGTMNPFGDMGNLNDPNAMANMMNSPAFLDQMATMLQNPEVVDQIIASDPQLAGMGPQIRQMLSSDQFRSFLTNPDAMRQMMQMQQMMGGGARGAGGAAAPAFPPPGAFGAAPPSPAGAVAAPGAANPFAAFGAPGAGGGGFGGMPMPTPEQMQQMQQMFGGGAGAGGFGGLGGFGGAGGGAAARAPADARPAHERFADQLVQLQAMGFYDGQSNIEALTVCGGNVSAAVEYLFSHPPPGGN
ncbi:hypothetical protein BDY24DRAFT_390296 [Mrakia frigida]|uniref:ubiquitin family protein n=1 Tax=Mrakia frigida TaxID=29902 RepID=UPI003FCBFF4C